MTFRPSGLFRPEQKKLARRKPTHFNDPFCMWWLARTYHIAQARGKKQDSGQMKLRICPRGGVYQSLPGHKNNCDCIEAFDPWLDQALPAPQNHKMQNHKIRKPIKSTSCPFWYCCFSLSANLRSFRLSCLSTFGLVNRWHVCIACRRVQELARL